MQIRSENLLKEEVLRTLTKTEIEICQASLSEHICDLLPSKFEKELRIILGIICVQYSIRKAPDQSASDIIIRFIRKRYEHLTLKEFALAFELNLLREDENKPEHFQNISVEFITDVIKYFLKLKTESLGALKRATPAAKQLAEHKSTPEDYYNRLVKYVEEKKELPIAWDWMSVYQYMEDNNMVTETLEEIKSFKEKVKAETKTQANLKKLKAADSIERMRIDEMFSPKNMSEIYKCEYVKMKLMRLYQ